MNHMIDGDSGHSFNSPHFRGKLIEVDCEKCQGTGIDDWHEIPCRHCEGLGKVIEKK